MKPSEVAFKLRQIAAAIDNSRNPRRDLVARDLKRIIAAVGPFDNFSGQIRHDGNGGIFVEGTIDTNGDTVKVEAAPSDRGMELFLDDQSVDESLVEKFTEYLDSIIPAEAWKGPWTGSF
jgi:hypothetical protein